MNNLLSFWLAPVTALFHPRVYRDATKRPGWMGVLYTLYLSLIGGVLSLVFMLGVALPLADEFVVWVQKSMPVVIWTPEGVSLENGQTTALLVHPKYGPIIAFDMTKTSVSEEEMGKALAVVTSQKIFTRRSLGQFESRDITKAGIQTTQQLPSKIRITGEVVGGFYKILRKMVLLSGPASVAILFFGFTLTMNLLYSLVGLLLNMMRKQKLRYGAIFSLTCFATTASFTLVWLQIMMQLPRWPLPFGVMIPLNLVYMFVAFKLSDSDDTKAKIV